MKTKNELLEELKRKQAAEIADFELEEKVRMELPEEFRESASICIHHHTGFVSVEMWNGFRTKKTLADAANIVSLFKEKIVQGEHWKSGCVSTWPAEINSCIKKEDATMDGSHEVEISVNGGKGFGPNIDVSFWVRLSCGLAEINCPTNFLKLAPRVHANYNRDGEVTSCDITWPQYRQHCDSFRTFWSEKPSYSGSYYWAESAKFFSFVEEQTEKAVSK